DGALVEPLAQVLKQLGSRHVMVVHADDGMDEISITGATQAAELKDGEVKCYSISPEDFSMPAGSLDDLKVDSVEASLAMIQSVFANTPGAALDIVCLNAGAAIYVSGLADSLQGGVEKAKAAIANGGPGKILNDLVSRSRTT
ncbi:MAG: anthranilate phosphoribosyltransferase, partial [Gammaproteobacteria bacterium]|nr:anthranilate phosphoribosyltransferase [Gammaproteobacteria bacterium]